MSNSQWKFYWIHFFNALDFLNKKWHFLNIKKCARIFTILFWSLDRSDCESALALGHSRSNGCWQSAYNCLPLRFVSASCLCLHRNIRTRGFSLLRAFDLDLACTRVWIRPNLFGHSCSCQFDSWKCPLSREVSTRRNLSKFKHILLKMWIQKEKSAKSNLLL